MNIVIYTLVTINKIFWVWILSPYTCIYMSQLCSSFGCSVFWGALLSYVSVLVKLTDSPGPPIIGPVLEQWVHNSYCAQHHTTPDGHHDRKLAKREHDKVKANRNTGTRTRKINISYKWIKLKIIWVREQYFRLMFGLWRPYRWHKPRQFNIAGLMQTATEPCLPLQGQLKITWMRAILAREIPVPFTKSNFVPNIFKKLRYIIRLLACTGTWFSSCHLCL